MGILVIVGCLFFITLFNKIYKSIINPNTIFNLWWFIITFFSLFGFSGINVPSNLTYFYIFIGILFFNVGTYLNCIIMGKRKRKLDKELSWNISIKNIKLNQIIIFNIICLIIMLPYTLKAISIIASSGFQYLRILAFNESNDFINSTLIHAVFQYIVNPFFLVVTILGVIFSLKQNRVHILLYLSFINAIVESITFGARTPISRIIEFYVIIYFLLKLNNKNNTIKIKKIFIVILIIPIIYLTLERGGIDFDFLNQFAIYYVGSFSLLDFYITNSTYFIFNEDFLTGRAFLGGLINPIIVILSVLYNFDYKLYGGDYIITSITSINQSIGNGIFMNAAPTWIFHLLKDLGFLGLIIYPLLFGFIVNHIYLRMIKRKDLLSIAIMSYLLYTIIKTTSGWMFLFIPTWMCIIFLIYFIKRGKNESNS